MQLIWQKIAKSDDLGAHALDASKPRSLIVARYPGAEDAREAVRGQLGEFATNTLEYLAREPELLTEDPAIPGSYSERARALLSDTRLLLDSPAANEIKREETRFETRRTRLIFANRSSPAT